MLVHAPVAVQVEAGVDKNGNSLSESDIAWGCPSEELFDEQLLTQVRGSFLSYVCVLCATTDRQGACMLVWEDSFYHVSV